MVLTYGASTVVIIYMIKQVFHTPPARTSRYLLWPACWSSPVIREPSTIYQNQGETPRTHVRCGVGLACLARARSLLSKKPPEWSVTGMKSATLGGLSRVFTPAPAKLRHVSSPAVSMTRCNQITFPHTDILLPKMAKMHTITPDHRMLINSMLHRVMTHTLAK
jgi:hypothetical protein